METLDQQYNENIGVDYYAQGAPSSGTPLRALRRLPAAAPPGAPMPRGGRSIRAIDVPDIADIQYHYNRVEPGFAGDEILD